MSNISQFFAGSRKKNRRIFQGSVGVTTVTWLVPPGVTEVEVHCWGAGGNGAFRGGGGGGGGYVTHIFPVVSGDSLLITAGASPGGTSSVSVPTQSPTSPISATGGAAAVGLAAGTGGTGSYTIAPGISTARTFSASGGYGGIADGPTAQYGGGAAAGSPQGTGGIGGNYGSGGGIGGPGGQYQGGGGSLGPGTPTVGGLGKNGVGFAATTLISYSSSNDDWFYVDEILGSGGPTGATAGTPSFGVPGGAGGGGGIPGGNGGILGGGAFPSGRGGLAGGGAGYDPTGGTGGAGLVILYW